jgi:adiponectin receptor
LDSYAHLDLDSGIERAWSTLHAVRDSCSRIGNDVIDAGRRRTAVLVEVLEERYNEALAHKETLEQKVQEGVSMMESFLAECETRANSVRDTGFGTVVHEFVGRQHKRMGSSVGRAKEAVDEGLDLAWRAAEKMELAVEKALAMAKKNGLINYHDLPTPWRINPHIIRGYRFHDTKRACLYSIVTPSNETFNIWSHLIGLIIVLSIAFYFYPTSAHFSLATKTDVLIAGIFFFAASKCLVCSCMWHTFNSIAEKDLMERFACVDYTGISLLVAASIMTTEYTAFYCEPTSRWIWISVTALFGIGGTILPWHPTFNKADLAWVRVAFYVLLAATGALPAIQISFVRGISWAAYFYSPIVKSLLVYICGAVLYAMKVPEVWFPGAFDYVGGSHNIWHLAVLGGILFHYHAMQEFFAQAFMRAYLQCSAW